MNAFFRNSPRAAGISRRSLLAGSAYLGLLGAGRSVSAGSSDEILRVGDQKGGLEALLFSAGELKSTPYKFAFSQFPAAAPLLEALNARAVDVAFAGDAPTTFALANGAPAKIISAHRSNGAGTALLSLPESPIRTIADLEGKIVATGRGSIGHALVISALKRHGVPVESVKLIFLLPAEAKMALVTKSVDAWSTWGVYVAQAQIVDKFQLILDGSDGILSGLSYINALNSAIAAKRAALTDLIARTARAQLWATKNVDDYARYWAGLVGTSFDVAKFSFQTAPMLTVPIDAKVIADQQRTADLYAEAGVIPKRIEAAGFFDASFNEALAI